ncbi:MAG: DMT family transporter [Gemmataceae bacterium]
MTPSPAQGRLLILAAAVGWSLSGLFTRVLSEPTPLDLHEPALTPLQIAAGRVLFAGLVMLPMLRPRDVSFRPLMAATALAFAAMNAMFIGAMALGSAANAILLQYTAPLWLYLAGVAFLGEPVERRGAVSLLIGLAGIAVIVWGGWQGEQAVIVLLGLGSGLGYALVLLGLRLQRDASPVWLTAVNHLTGAVVLLPFVWHLGLPTPRQVAWLALFGTVQMGLPYLLMARGLKTVRPSEAGTLTLLEPILNPLWAYLVAPEKERPTVHILLGGLCILGALAYRYWPRPPRAPPVGNQGDDCTRG